MNYIETLKKRRSYYDLSKNIGISDKQIKNMIKRIILESPTAFNMQSSHVVLLLNKQHEMLWNIVSKTLEQIIPAERFAATRTKLSMFSQAKGTVLFFEDEDQVKKMKEDFPLYQKAFDDYVPQSMGMLQVNLWNAFADLDIGANLQHYNPLIDEEVKKTWNIPESYRLTAQLVFGHSLSEVEPKEKIPVEQRFQVFE